MAKLETAYCNAVATEIWRQICATTRFNVVFSWGIAKRAYAEFEGKAALVIKVNGFKLKGHVVIMLNEGTDTYEIVAISDGEIVNRLEDIYCDMLGSVLDSVIERDASWSDDEYTQRVRSAYA